MKRYYSVVGPVFLIALGLLVWFSKMGWVDIIWRRDWPLIIVAIGVLQLMSSISKRCGQG